MTCTRPKGHHYQKFDDVSLFCEHCGDRKFIAAGWSYHWDWTYRPYPYYQPYFPNWQSPFVYTVTSGMDTTTGITPNTMIFNGSDPA